MPLGFERINARKRQPNELINFIKPLEGPDKEFAQDFLERIAAICVPIMKANHLAVMSLEEYPPNREFVGRNFNAGEVIQLVLKGYGTNRWLSFREVQMVMMHELAHCKQMNHSGAFWKVRNKYCDELRALWTRSYTGEGFWSRGQTLLSGRYTSDAAPLTEIQPHSLCGGTYRTRTRKRKQGAEKQKLSYAERKQRRIAKKFGVSGMALGGDEETRTKLENGKTTASKPRVANSKRGRELRANALLQRLEDQKKEQAAAKVEVLSDSDSESDSDLDVKEEDQAIDIDGSRLFDQKGKALVRICAGEGDGDDQWKDELRELRSLETEDSNRQPSSNNHANNDSRLLQTAKPDHNELPNRSIASIKPSSISNANKGTSDPETKPPTVLKRHEDCRKQVLSTPKTKPKPSEIISLDDSPKQNPDIGLSSGICIVCSFENHPGDLRCMACGNVLDPTKGVGHWHCKSVVCKDSNYVNANDCGICGVCGTKKL